MTMQSSNRSERQGDSVSNLDTIDSESIDVDGLEYLVAFVSDDYPDAPYNEGFGFAFNGDRRGSIDVADGALATEILAILRDNIVDWRHDGRPRYRHSSAAIARYLRVAHGLHGVLMVDSDYYTSAPSAQRESIAGIAWAPADVPAGYADRYTEACVTEYRAWATGDVVGYVMTAPDGQEVDSCWGYYGYDANYDHMLECARESATAHAHALMDSANLVGAGFVGVI